MQRGFVHQLCPHGGVPSQSVRGQGINDSPLWHRQVKSVHPKPPFAKVESKIRCSGQSVARETTLAFRRKQTGEVSLSLSLINIHIYIYVYAYVYIHIDVYV